MSYENILEFTISSNGIMSLKVDGWGNSTVPVKDTPMRYENDKNLSQNFNTIRNFIDTQQTVDSKPFYIEEFLKEEIEFTSNAEQYCIDQFSDFIEVCQLTGDFFKFLEKTIGNTPNYDALKIQYMQELINENGMQLIKEFYWDNNIDELKEKEENLKMVEAHDGDGNIIIPFDL